MIPSRFLFGDVWGFRLSANTAVSHRKLWSKKSGTTIVVEFWIWSVTFQIVGGASSWAEASWCCWWYIYIWRVIWPKVKEVKKWQDVFWEYLLGSIHNRHWLNMIPIIDVHYYPSSTVQWSRGCPCGNQPQNQFWWYHHFNLTK